MKSDPDHPITKLSNRPPSRRLVEELLDRFPDNYPSDYLEFIKRHNGGYVANVSIDDVKFAMDINEEIRSYEDMADAFFFCIT